MYNELIEKYIHLLTVDHIKKYASKNNIIINEDEANIIFNFIKENYKVITSGNIDSLLPLKDKLNTNTYNQLVILYKDACIKYLI